MVRRLLTLAAVLAAAGCAREIGSPHARAHAGSDARAVTGEAATFTASCEGCSGAASFHWSMPVAPTDGSCALEGAEQDRVQVSCDRPGSWVLRVDVRDGHGDGSPDYANLTVRPAPTPPAVDGGEQDGGPVDAGSVDAGSVDAGPLDAGPLDAGPIDAGPIDAGPIDAGPIDAGPLTGTLVVTLPDGTPAASVLPGDLLELHATPSDPSAGCSFDTLPSIAQYLGSSAGPCAAAVVVTSPVASISFGVTFTRGSETASATTGNVVVQDAVKPVGNTLAVRSVAVDAVTGFVAATRPNHSVLVYDPNTGSSQNVNTHFGGIASAAGGVLDLGWASGIVGREYADGGEDTDFSIPAGDFISVTTVARFEAGDYRPVFAGTDGNTLVAWTDSLNLNDTNFPSDVVARIVDPASSGDLSAGVLTLSGGDTLHFIPWSNLRAFGDGNASLAPRSVKNGLGLNSWALAASTPLGGGTVWLADDSGGLYRFVGTGSSTNFDLPSSPNLELASDSPVTAMSAEYSGPYAGDLWVAANGFVYRVIASANTVGVQPTVVALDFGTLDVSSLDVDVGASSRLIYLGASSGLFVLSP